MRNTVKKYFIPHKENDFRPHFFHGKNMAIVASLALTIFIFAFFQRVILVRTDLAAVITSVLVDLTNKDRASLSRRPLIINPVLTKAAQMKADDMVEKGYFAHFSPEGVSPWHWFSEAGYDFLYAGENLAVNFSESIDVEKAWMASPKHRENILNAHFTEIGIAVAKGVYKGYPTIFVVQMFGKPASVAVSSVPAPKIVSEPSVSPIVPESTPVFTPATEPAKASGTPFSPELAGTGIAAGEQIDLVSDFNSGDMETFTAVKNIEAVDIQINENVSEPDVSAGNTPRYSGFMERAVSSPGATMILLYVFMSLIIVTALFVFVVVEIKRQHPKNIFYALLVLAFIALLGYLGDAFVFAGAVIQ
jgi:hypothetical protein